MSVRQAQALAEVDGNKEEGAADGRRAALRLAEVDLRELEFSPQARNV